jgi:multidrug resistance efflux pump
MTTDTETPTAADNTPEQPPKSRRGFLLRALLVVIVLAAIAWTLWYFLDGRWYEGTDDAYVQGNVVQVTPQVAGTVVQVDVQDTQPVVPGQLLVALDPSDARAALDEAQATLAQTVREVRQVYGNDAAEQHHGRNGHQRARAFGTGGVTGDVHSASPSPWAATRSPLAIMRRSSDFSWLNSSLLKPSRCSLSTFDRL